MKQSEARSEKPKVRSQLAEALMKLSVFPRPAAGLLFVVLLAALLFLPANPAFAAAKDREPASTPKEESKNLIREGLNCLIMERNKKAEEAFLKAKSIDPYSEEAHNFLGLLYLQEGLNSKAEEMLQRAVAIDPMYSEALRNIGKLYLQLERFEDAVS